MVSDQNKRRRAFGLVSPGFSAEPSGIHAGWDFKVNDRFEAEKLPASAGPPSAGPPSAGPPSAGPPSRGRKINDTHSTRISGLV